MNISFGKLFLACTMATTACIWAHYHIRMFSVITELHLNDVTDILSFNITKEITKHVLVC